MFQTTREEALCQIFVLTLTGDASIWFEALPAACIDNFAKLEKMFLRRFRTAIPLKKTTMALFDVVRQRAPGGFA